MAGRIRNACLLAVLFLAIIATLCEPIHGQDQEQNQCPQPTESNPIVLPKYYAHPDDCSKFYQCAHGTPIEKECLTGTVYNEQLNNCVGIGTEADKCTSADPIHECDNGIIDLIPHPTLCQRYYNCTDNSTRGWFNMLKKYENDCPYLKVYDIHFKKCVTYQLATCGKNRAMPKWESEEQNQCPQPTPFNPVVRSKYYAHPDDCAKYYQCANGIPIEKKCAPGTVYNEQFTTCVHAGMEMDTCTPANPVRECKNGNVKLIPHPTECQRYYNCSDTSRRGWYSLLGRYEQECNYPEVYDIRLKKCVGYEVAVCGKNRVMPTWECQYKRYQCPKSHCIPCFVRYPSCVNREDGFWPRRAGQWAQNYIVCHNQRAKPGLVGCTKHSLTGITQLFHVERRQCVPLWETIYYPSSCLNKDAGIYVVRELDIISFQCPGKNFYYCKTPYYVHNDIEKCTAI